MFNITLVDHNNPTQKLETQAISDGYWIFLHSLPLGRNEIFFKVETVLADNERSKKTGGSKNSNLTEVFYCLNVVDN